MNISQFKGGWVVGQFEPCLIKSSRLEVGIKFINKGTKGDGHYHMKSDEFTILISGSALDKGKIYGPGDIIVIKKKEKNFTFFLEDSLIISMRNNSVPKDKHYD